MNGIAAVARFDSYPHLPDAVRDDTLVRIEADPGVLHGAWTTEGGYALASADSYGGDPCWLNVIGTPAVASALVEAAMAELGEACCGLTVPRGVDIERWIGPGQEPDAWDLMRCDQAPPTQAAEHRVTVLTDLATVQAFLDRVNPHHSVRAEHREVELWMGVADEADGALLAVGAFTRRPSGAAYLASIATAEPARGQGLGAAVTAALTRYAFASGDVLCTLAHYHPNEPARRVYQRLGYQTTHQNHSHTLPRPASAADRTDA